MNNTNIKQITSDYKTVKYIFRSVENDFEERNRSSSCLDDGRFCDHGVLPAETVSTSGKTTASSSGSSSSSSQGGRAQFRPAALDCLVRVAGSTGIRKAGSDHWASLPGNGSSSSQDGTGQPIDSAVVSFVFGRGRR